ncbi:hypothetical protein Q3G72_030926 [Acer saccharum]|nr:hypothetical protein Q3G72_030926 [Acer saccharum]
MVLELFDQIKNENLKMNKVSAGSALSAAGEMGDLEKGKEIQDCVMQQYIDIDILLATSIMNMYPEEAVSLFRDMQTNYLRPNSITLMTILPACAQLSLLRLGKSVHCYALRANIDYDISTGTALVSMYAKCRFFRGALTILNTMPCKDVISWNALINGYIQNGFPYHAIEIFHELGLSEISPDSGTMVSLLQACVLLNDLDLGSYIHGQIIKYAFQFDCHVMNALVDMYAKCGNLSSAEMLFYRTDFGKDEVSWNIIIS